MALNDVYQLTVGINQDGQKLVQVFLYQQKSASGPQRPEKELEEAWQYQMLPLWRACMSNQASVEVLRVRKYNDPDAPSFMFAIDEEGDINEPALAPNSVAIITLYTSVATKSGRGRTHFSAIPQTYQSDGIIFEDLATAYNALATALCQLLPGFGSGADFQAGRWVLPEAAFHDFATFALRGQIFTLRSRRMANP